MRLTTPAAAMARWLSRLTGMGKRYGVEWWILVAGAVIVLAIISMALFSDTIAPFSPYDQNTGPQLSPPNGQHLMGTDNLHRDVWSRIVHGSQTILRVAVLAAIISSLIGIILGLISGFRGGILDRLISLIMDSVYSFPGLILGSDPLDQGRTLCRGGQGDWRPGFDHTVAVYLPQRDRHHGCGLHIECCGCHHD